MSKKFSAQRKGAFLTYLSQTGNVTLSAERAKVSRSWVQLQRSGDAAFDAACRAALAEAKRALEALALPPHPSAADAAPSLSREGRGAKWRYFEGHELVVRGTGGSGGGKRVQIGRAREKQWTPRTEKRFLSALAATCNVKAACAEVALWPSGAYNHRDRWPAFDQAWDEALAEGCAELEAAVVLKGRNLFSGAPGAADRESAPGVRIVDMTAGHALAALNAYRRRVPPESLGGGGGDDAAAKVEIIARIEKAMTNLGWHAARARRG